MAYLLSHPNPNAPERDNGVRYWGEPDRGGHRPRLVVIHTSQSAFDTVGTDTGAEGVAGFLSRVTRPASYHGVSDSDSAVELLPDEHVAFGTRGGFNPVSLHECFAGDAYRWDELDADQVEARLRMAAARVRRHCNRWSIPVRRLTRSEVLDGAAGICGHADTDPDRRSDPGAEFPWDRFLQLVDDDTATPAPKPKPTNWTERLVDNLPLLKARTDLHRASDDDRRVQGLLAAAGVLDIAPNLDGKRFDGKFGPSTKAAVRTFQSRAGLRVDGIVGRNTWTALLGR